ncbi:MAG: DUF11 domain-containing protein [bacterium]|nr:DUF11 domain-containing protein [bacterium]
MQQDGQRRQMAAVLVLVAAMVTGSDRASALGTPAGTEVTTQAAVTWTKDAESFSGASNPTTFTVDEVVDFALVWQDAGDVEAFPGETGMALTYRLQNTGNGPERFLLTGLTALAGDDFDPALDGLYLDTDGNGRYDAGVDEIYALGANDPLLDADAAAILFLVADVPADATDAQEGHCKLVVTAGTGVGAPGTIVVGAGVDGTDVVIGTGGGFRESTGVFRIASVAVSLVKSAIVAGPGGGIDPVPGSVVTYYINVTADGGGTARSVVVTDPVPAPAVYIPDTLRLNGGLLSDAADMDAGDYSVTVPGALTVQLGDLTATSQPQIIAFQVSIP